MMGNPCNCRVLFERKPILAKMLEQQEAKTLDASVGSERTGTPLAAIAEGGALSSRIGSSPGDQNLNHQINTDAH